MLECFHTKGVIEAGCDEAGRGCLAGPVFAAAVILPEGYCNAKLNDSKQLNEKERNTLRTEIQNDSIAWAVASLDNNEIDQRNILRASLHAMNIAVAKLEVKPEHLIIDGNRFYDENGIPFVCIVKGDAKYQSIAAASILAKTYRDDYMRQLHTLFPVYGWDRNKGYPTASHYAAIEQYGISPYHRKSFNLYRQTTLDFATDP